MHENMLYLSYFLLLHFFEWIDNAVAEKEKYWFLLPNLHWRQMGFLLFIISRQTVHGNVGKLILNWCKSSLFNYIFYFQVSMLMIIIKK